MSGRRRRIWQRRCWGVGTGGAAAERSEASEWTRLRVGGNRSFDFVFWGRVAKNFMAVGWVLWPGCSDKVLCAVGWANEIYNLELLNRFTKRWTERRKRRFIGVSIAGNIIALYLLAFIQATWYTRAIWCNRYYLIWQWADFRRRKASYKSMNILSTKNGLRYTAGGFSAHFCG